MRFLLAAILVASSLHKENLLIGLSADSAVNLTKCSDIFLQGMIRKGMFVSICKSTSGSCIRLVYLNAQFTITFGHSWVGIERWPS